MEGNDNRKPDQPGKEGMPDIWKFVPESLNASSAANSNRITRDYLDSLLIEYRHVGAERADISTEIFGRRFDSPIMIGGMAAMVPILNPAGMAAFGEAAASLNTVCFSGYVDSPEFEKMCRTGAACIRIIKPLQDMERVLAEVKHDEACGAFACAMDIDHGFGDDGEYFPPVRGGAYGSLSPKTSDELKAIAEASSLPFIAKGVLSVRDALLCKEAGAKGIILSHHKGEYDYAVPPLMMLPEIRRAVGDDFVILADCGITSGMDAFKALALGADGVCVARPLIKPYTSDGAAGIEKTLAMMNGQLRAAMGRTGSSTVKNIDSSVIHVRNF